MTLPLEESRETAPLYLVWRGDPAEARLFDLDWIRFEGPGVSEPRSSPVPRHGDCEVDGDTPGAIPGGSEPGGGGCSCRASSGRSNPWVLGLLLLLGLVWARLRDGSLRLNPVPKFTGLVLGFCGRGFRRPPVADDR